LAATFLPLAAFVAAAFFFGATGLRAGVMSGATRSGARGARYLSCLRFRPVDEGGRP
jgi:hypothetical protein